MESKIDISVKICDTVFNNCLMNASGCVCTTKDELNNLCETGLGAVVSKSGTIKPREGNKEPRFFMDTLGSVNSMGIPNLGYEFYLDYSLTCSKPLIISIYPFYIEELKEMINNIQSKAQKQLFVEINLTCPNVGNFRSNVSLLLYLETLSELKTDKLVLGLKMKPYYEFIDFEKVSEILLRFKDKIKFITCCNSIVNALIVDSEKETTRIHPNIGLGGLGGQYVKPTCLSNVYNFYRLLGNDMLIIGCGGISSGQDIFEYILCGASLVQVGTHLVRSGNNCIGVLLKELEDIMSKKGYKSLVDFRGKLNIAKFATLTTLERRPPGS